jgi:hypothetical protein
MDDAVVADVGADQINAAAARGLDFSLVDDVLCRTVMGEQISPGEEIGVVDVECAGNKSGHVHATAGTNHDAGRIDEPDTAIRTQGAVDCGRIVGEDAVKD